MISNKSLVTAIRKELRDNADAKYKQGTLHYFKEKIKPYGVKSAIVHGISKKYFARIKDAPREKVFMLCEELWRSGYIEESFISADWAYCLQKSFVPADIRIFEKWIGKYVGNWASCDSLCNHAVGELIEKYPKLIRHLKRWARSKNRWMKRASAVTIILPARKGLFLHDILEIADILLKDGDDMVQKGYGWMLKEASRKHQREIFEYVMKNKAVMPRTALRYAIEKMPEIMRKRALAK
jgi:3-methyladenine DNA glycosylase AlkD